MDYLVRWDANFSNHQRRQLQLIEFIEQFSQRNGAPFDVKSFEEEFSVCGPLFVIRLISAIKRSFNCAREVDMHLRVLLIFFQSSDWERFLSREDTANCLHVLLSVASLNPSESFMDVQQTLLVLRRMISSPHALQLFAEMGGVDIVCGVIERSLDIQLHRTSLSILFECATLARFSVLPPVITRLFNSPRGTSKYCALSLCRQLFSSAHRSPLLNNNCQDWLQEALPQLVRLLINNPIFYQYEVNDFNSFRFPSLNVP